MQREKVRRHTNSNFEKMLAYKQREGNPFKGWAFQGIMVSDEYDLSFLLEWNARPGDPEAQVIIPGLGADYFELGDAIANGDISKININKDNKTRLVTAIVARGYPRNYDTLKGSEIKSIDELKKFDDVNIYGAGVSIDSSGIYRIDGGRVFYLQTSGENILDARKKMEPALEVIAGIDGEYLRFRTDIGWRDVARLQSRTN